jgi:hypothetical protein
MIAATYCETWEFAMVSAGREESSGRLPAGLLNCCVSGGIACAGVESSSGTVFGVLVVGFSCSFQPWTSAKSGSGGLVWSRPPTGGDPCQRTKNNQAIERRADPSITACMCLDFILKSDMRARTVAYVDGRSWVVGGMSGWVAGLQKEQQNL